MAAIWRINSIARLRWRHWEEGYILFNAASAQTHLLNEFGKTVVELLQQAPCGAAELSGRVAARLDLEWNVEAQRYLQNFLVDLDELGLIEPVTP